MKRAAQISILLTVFMVAESGERRGTAPFPPEVSQASRASKPAGGASENRLDDELAVAALMKMGVPLQRDVAGRVRWIEATKGEFNDDAMRRLSGLPMLEWLEIGGGNVTATGISHLKGCSALTRLYIHDVHLSDDALAVLTDVQRLEALSLQRTGITGKVLKRLNAVSTLRVLNLSGDDIGDDDIAQVARFVGLEVLALQNTRVTGAGLGKLEGMARLNVLNVSNCRFVDDDLKHFNFMPNLRIVHAAGCNLSDKAIDDLKEKLPMLAIFQ